MRRCVPRPRSVFNDSDSGSPFDGVAEMKGAEKKRLHGCALSRGDYAYTTRVPKCVINGKKRNDGRLSLRARSLVSYAIVRFVFVRDECFFPLIERSHTHTHTQCVRRPRGKIRSAGSDRAVPGDKQCNDGGIIRERGRLNGRVRGRSPCLGWVPPQRVRRARVSIVTSAYR